MRSILLTFCLTCKLYIDANKGGSSDNASVY